MVNTMSGGRTNSTISLRELLSSFCLIKQSEGLLASAEFIIKLRKQNIETRDLPRGNIWNISVWRRTMLDDAVDDRLRRRRCCCCCVFFFLCCCVAAGRRGTWAARMGCVRSTFPLVNRPTRSHVQTQYTAQHINIEKIELFNMKMRDQLIDMDYGIVGWYGRGFIYMYIYLSSLLGYFNLRFFFVFFFGSVQKVADMGYPYQTHKKRKHK